MPALWRIGDCAAPRLKRMGTWVNGLWGKRSNGTGRDHRRPTGRGEWEQTESGTMPELIIRSGKHQGKKLVLPKNDVTIGRGDDCQIKLATEDVSRQHCILRSTPQGLVLSDLGSSNGTLVNDVRIDSERLLVPGDTIRIGPIILEVPGGESSTPADTDPAGTDPADSAQAEFEASIQAVADEEAASADDIANWLTENEEPSGSGTTTIIAVTSLDGTESDQSEADGEHATPKSDPNKKKFKSIAEEAAHIISCWKELVAQEDA